MPSAADFTLNPLPSSVQWSTSLFTLRNVGGSYTMPAGAARVLHGGTGDLTGDGWPEVVISGWSYRSTNAVGTPPEVPISIFSVTASGVTQLDTASILGVTSSPGTAMLRIADFTGDGRNDLLIVGYNESPFVNTTSTLWVATASGFTARNVGPKLAAHEGETGDINGDGRLDFVTSAYYTERVLDSYFYTGNNGNWVQGNSAQTPMLLLQVNQGGGAFQTLPLNLSNTITEHRASATPWTTLNWSGGSASAIADLDGDGRAEVIAVDLRASGKWTRGDNYLITDIRFDATSAAGRLIELPTPYFDDKARYASMQSIYGDEKTHDIQVQVLDFDNDGRPDILVHTMVWHNDTPAGIIQFLRNKGGLSFEDVTDQVLYNTWLGKSESSHDSLLMDVNGDGFFDIVNPGEPVYNSSGSVTNTWSNEVFVNTGAGKFVSVMWSQFHTMTLQMSNNYDQRMFPYMTPDGRLGFISAKVGSATTFFNVEATAKIGTGPGGIDPSTRGAPGFNEAFYLTENPGVAAAVTAGTYASGLEHYLAVGRAQGLAAFARNAIVTGGSGADNIVLREGNERALGDDGSDTIVGGAGNDTLEGGLGLDSLTGGAGSDRFILMTQGLADVIDFSVAQRDSIGLYTAAGAVVVGTGGMIVHNRTTGVLSWDSDADGSGGIQFAAWSGTEALSQSSFAAGFQPSYMRTIINAAGSQTTTTFHWGNATYDRTSTTFDHLRRPEIYESWFLDGSSSIRYLDPANVADFSVRAADYNAQGGMTAYSVTRDDGGRTLYQFDLANTRFWSRLVEEYDALGRMSQQSFVRDDGTFREMFIDTYDTQPWATHVRDYAASGAIVADIYYRADGSIFG